YSRTNIHSPVFKNWFNMNSKEIKDIIYNVLRPYYRPIGQNKIWEMVQETFYIFVNQNPESKIPTKLERKLDESRKFSKPTFKKALVALLEDGRVYVYDDKETRLGRKLYYAR